MAPGGGVYKGEVESHLKNANYDIAVVKADKNITPLKPKISSSEKYGVASINGVHELLQCPVCRGSLYPPIHQV